jgi:hypothetical protein
MSMPPPLASTKPKVSSPDRSNSHRDTAATPRRHPDDITQARSLNL